MAENMNDKEETSTTNKKRSKVFLIVLILLVIAGGWFGLTKYLHAQKHEETDNAQIAASISPVIPRVGGYITEVRVKDNQVVKKGDTLLILDDRDLKLKVDQAEAALATAKSNLGQAEAMSNASRSNITTAQSSIGTIDKQIESAKINARRTSDDFERYSNLFQDHSITQVQYEQAKAAKEIAEKQVDILIQQKNQAQQQTNAVASQSNATSSQIGVAGSVIKQREVDVEQAKLNLTYAAVVAQESGTVSTVNVQSGQFVQPGQPLFNIVLNDVWVVANFKETQLEKMMFGQRVSISVDAYPGHTFEATITSISPATGAKFSLLPPDNASGNFVKVTQRVGVKIEFTNPADSMIKYLRAGMNVNVDVHLK